MTDHPEQATLAIRGKPLLECERVDVSPDVRVYYLPHGHTFDFFVARFAACGSDTPEPYMDSPETEVECLFHGVAYHDGLTHLYMGSTASDNVGYLYYADPGELARVFGVLAELERRFCPHADRRAIQPEEG